MCGRRWGGGHSVGGAHNEHDGFSKQHKNGFEFPDFGSPLTQTMFFDLVARVEKRSHYVVNKFHYSPTRLRSYWLERGLPNTVTYQPNHNASIVPSVHNVSSDHKGHSVDTSSIQRVDIIGLAIENVFGLDGERHNKVLAVAYDKALDLFSRGTPSSAHVVRKLQQHGFDKKTGVWAVNEVMKTGLFSDDVAIRKEINKLCCNGAFKRRDPYGKKQYLVSKLQGRGFNPMCIRDALHDYWDDDWGVMP